MKLTMVGLIIATVAVTDYLTSVNAFTSSSYHAVTINQWWLYNVNQNIVIFHGFNWLIAKTHPGYVFKKAEVMNDQSAQPPDPSWYFHVADLKGNYPTELYQFVHHPDCFLLRYQHQHCQYQIENFI
jgi:hypothetical protein